MLRTALIVTLAACGSAQVVQRTQVGGTMELSGDRGKAMDDADDKMTSHCGANNYSIVNEGFEPKNTAADDTSATTTTPTSGTVWRIHYQCNGAVATPPPAPQATPAPAPTPAAPAPVTH